MPRIAQAQAAALVDTKVFKEKADLFTKKIASQRQAIDKEKFPEAEKLLAKIEKKSEDLAKAPPSSKDRMMVELNAADGRPQGSAEAAWLAGAGETAAPAAQGDGQPGAGGPARQGPRQGGLQESRRAAQATSGEAGNGQDERGREKVLKEQLSEMAKKLSDLANMDQRKKQLEEAKKNGGLTEKQFAREMEKLEEQAKQLKQIQKLASKLGDAQKALQAGDAKKAAESLGMSQQQMQEMAKQLEELESLDGAMAELQDAKNGMAGDGMNQIGNDMNSFGMGNGMRKGMGNGLGRGRGQGDRPIAETETATYTSKVKQQLKKGKAVFQGLTAPTNTVKGDVVIQMQEEMEAAEGLNAEALSNQKIPRRLEKHIKAYYDQLNKGN